VVEKFYQRLGPYIAGIYLTKKGAWERTGSQKSKQVGGACRGEKKKIIQKNELFRKRSL